ncbi:hypothetical protein ACHAXR_006093 [Thalassiosira sp. AJA248-18]
MDLRAPLHDVNDGGDGKSAAGLASSKKYNAEGIAPWVSPSIMPPSKLLDARLYEKILYNLLCRMYAASQTMELGSESRFTGLVLFHRYARHFYCMVQHQQRQQHSKEGQSTEELKQLNSHLGSVAAACLFLGAKMEEEPRRIRDVINLSHVLNFSAWDENNSIIDSSLDAQEQHQNNVECSLEERNPSSIPTITIIEAPHPPPLDESYWTSKEQMVSTEQHVLRMIRFDTTVCHPHRCVLTIMETLGFGTGKSNANGKEDIKHANNNWLLTSDQSEHVIVSAWRILNEAPLDPTGLALQYPVIVLSCAVISIAATDGCCSANPGRSDVDKKDDAKNKDGMLPKFWWRALDVSTNDITMARDALKKVCFGGKN